MKGYVKKKKKKTDLDLIEQMLMETVCPDKPSDKELLERQKRQMKYKLEQLRQQRYKALGNSRDLQVLVVPKKVKS
jgi:hypothetical protein